MKQLITVLIADDHPVVREGILAYLQTQPDMTVVAEAATGTDAVHLAVEHRPDVVLLDLVMPEMDGIDVIRHIRHAVPQTRIVVLTSFHDDEHIFPALKAGALSYLLKDIKPKELAEAVRQAARGEAILHSRVATRLVHDLHSEHPSSNNPFTALTAREYEVLELIAAGKSNAEIAAQLTLSEKTIKGYVSNILDKLYLTDRTQAAVWAWREGIVRRMP